MSSDRRSTQRNGKIRLVCVSDTHNHAPGEGYKLPPGDILIHAGDLTNQGNLHEIKKAAKWLEDADFAVKVVVAGNHDLSLDKDYRLKHAEGWSVTPEKSSESREIMKQLPGVSYLEHQSIDVQVKGITLRVFGSPYSMDQAAQNWAFQYDDGQGEKLWSAIPEDTDILVTHTPPKSLLDSSRHWPDGGCPALLEKIQAIRPIVHVCGHHHEGRGALLIDWSRNVEAVANATQWIDPGAENKKQSLLSLMSNDLNRGRKGTAIVNASIMKTSWSASGQRLFNKPIVVDIPVTSKTAGTFRPLD